MRIHRKKPYVSIIIPFKDDNSDRKRIFRWLLEYWRHEIPEAEIIVVNSSKRGVFCKTAAFNRGVKKAKSDILVLMDADAYFSGNLIRESARRIRKSVARGYPLWIVPYRRLWRLNQSATDRILASSPKNPERLDFPPNPNDLEDPRGTHSKYGHHYGAVAYIIPREAYKVLGCFDERFNAGWGGEDVATLFALDTLYGKHKTLDADIAHLLHHKIGNTWNDRMWADQISPGGNFKLASRYSRARGDKAKMRSLVDEGCHNKPKRFSRLPWKRIGLLTLTVAVGISAALLWRRLS